jgi:tRNA pseudouridine38-40 synthase
LFWNGWPLKNGILRTVKRYQATLAYEGTAYCGFQRQRAGQPTVQEMVERALTAVTHQPIPLLAAGRTDTGVHATGQVIAFDLAWRHGSEKLLRALNANLPPDVAVLAVAETSATFHPRYDALRRRYEYVVEECLDGVPRPFTRTRHWQLFEVLDVAEMNRAAEHLLGVHDFATFGTPPHGENSVREMFVANWRREGELLIFTIEANAFLYRMVRSIVGTLKLVGDGRWPVAKFVAGLAAADRRYAGTTAPAHGLYLVSVTYPDQTSSIKS